MERKCEVPDYLNESEKSRKEQNKNSYENQVEYHRQSMNENDFRLL